MDATNNGVQFMINGKTNTRFDPVFKIKSYTAASKPQYVYLYRNKAHNFDDTTRLVEGFGYTAALDRNAHTLMVQLDTVFGGRALGIQFHAEPRQHSKKGAVHQNAFGQVDDEVIEPLLRKFAEQCLEIRAARKVCPSGDLDAGEFFSDQHR